MHDQHGELRGALPQLRYVAEPLGEMTHWAEVADDVASQLSSRSDASRGSAASRDTQLLTPQQLALDAA